MSVAVTVTCCREQLCLTWTSKLMTIKGVAVAQWFNCRVSGLLSVS